MSKPVPSKREEKAAAFLRDKGWGVTEPACPICHGSGYVWDSASNNFDGSTIQTISQRPCPDGCVAPAWFFYGSATTPTTTVTNLEVHP